DSGSLLTLMTFFGFSCSIRLSISAWMSSFAFGSVVTPRRVRIALIDSSCMEFTLENLRVDRVRSRCEPRANARKRTSGRPRTGDHQPFRYSAHRLQAVAGAGEHADSLTV